MAQELLSAEYMTMIATGIVVGTGARISTIKEDTRQYPSYPNGVLINVVTGLIAATIGAVFPITLLTKNFVGVSFLMLAVQQFRDVRKTERESLNDLEKTEFTPRGSAYIDGIAKTFESRNYLALICSLLSVTVMLLTPGDNWMIEVPLGVIIPFIALYLLRRYTKGKLLGDFAAIQLATIKFEGSMLYVDDIPVTNVGLPEAQELLLTEGIGVMISPRTVGGQVALANYGQRQSVIHEAARTFGLKRYLYMRRDFRNGRFCFAMVPIRRDEGALLELVSEVPLLESTRKSERLRNTEGLPQSKGD